MISERIKSQSNLKGLQLAFISTRDCTMLCCRRYVPELKDMPLQYLFEPWRAPLKVQQEAGCIVGQDYPSPMVDHKIASRECRLRMDLVKKRSEGKQTRVGRVMSGVCVTNGYIPSWKRSHNTPGKS